jgi:hypothetical protein
MNNNGSSFPENDKNNNSVSSSVNISDEGMYDIFSSTDSYSESSDKNRNTQEIEQIISQKKDRRFRDEDTGEINPNISSIDYSNTAGGSSAEVVNGVSYNRLSRKNRIDRIVLNNDEPLSIAVRHMILQLLFIIIGLISIVGILAGVGYLRDKMMNDSYLSLGMSSKYSTPVSVSISDFTYNYAPGTACISAVSPFLGNNLTESQVSSLTDNKNETRFPEGMVKICSAAFTGYTASVNKNESNSSFLKGIYDSLANGIPVIIKFTSSDANGKTVYTWGIVSSIDFSGDIITVTNAYGVTKKFDTDSFIASTNGSELSSVFMKFEFITGLQSKNTSIIFIKDE